jgi:Xaa-Pro aminopeptidase
MLRSRSKLLLVPAFAAWWLAAAAQAQQPGPGPARSSMVEGPTKAEYRARRASLMEAIKKAEAGGRPGAGGVVVVLVGGGEPGEDARFRQENDFRYLTGIEQPHASAILRPDSGEETLYLPPRNPAQDRWIGPRLGPGPEAADRTGFGRVESTGAFLADLFRAIGDPRTGDRSPSAAVVYLLDPAPRPTSTTPAARFSRFAREGAPSARFKDVATIVHEMRKGKSEAEANLIRRAVAVTADAHREVTRLIRPGLPEYRLEGAILGAFTAGGASRAGFPSIVGSGPNSTVLHYEKNDRTIEDGDLCVVDIGGEYKGYTADITRTYPANGRFTPRQREVYQLVLDAQSAAVAAFKPGQSTIGELNRTVREFFKASPVRARDDQGAEQTMDHFFAHGLGHHMGLDVHDVGDQSKPLQVGEVFTIEPGLYIPRDSLGVRIEDDYRVTPEGLEKLSKAIPVEVEEVERAIARGRAESTTP